MSRRRRGGADPNGGGYSTSLSFSGSETRDLLIAWLALGVAFAVFFAGGGNAFLRLVLDQGTTAAGVALVVSLLTAGIGFLLHELAHKVMAIRFDHVAEFRADYSMLFLAVMSAMLGFIFAAPGAVYHRGVDPSKRENGLIALAGPVVNLLLGATFIPLLGAGLATGIDVVLKLGSYGLVINLFLAGFNMLPLGSLDGRTVVSWNPLVWGVVFFPSAILAFFALVFVGI